MKLVCLAFIVLFSLPVFSQTDTILVFQDHKGNVVPENKARTYYVQFKENGQFKRIVYDIFNDKPLEAGYYADDKATIPEGPYNEFHTNGRISTAGRYAMGKKTGLWKSLDAEGKLLDSAYYKDDFIQGLSLRWNSEGIITDSLLFKEGGNGMAKGIWPGGIVKYHGDYLAGKKSGSWTYYFANGMKSQEVNYVADSAMTFTCYDEKGKLQTKNCFYEREADFPGGTSGWTNFLRKNLDADVPVKKKAKDGMYTVIVRFIVSPDGAIKDILAETSHGHGMEEEVIRIIEKGPRWIPAIQYNRPVNAYRRQPVTFMVSGE